MIGDIAIVRRPKRKTHIAIANSYSMCNVSIGKNAAFAFVRMSGGANNRVVNELRREFNDETCCKRCTAIVAMLVICYATRDKGKVFING